MRIALVITELLPGGAEKCFVKLACYLNQHGHEVQVWQLWPNPPAEKQQLTQQLAREGIRWSSGNAIKPWDFWFATTWLKRELATYRPDVVQAFLFHANLACALAVRPHSCRLFGGARVAQPQWWRQQLQRWAVRRMEKLVCVSHSVASHIVRNERVPQEKLCVIPNGISVEDLENPVAVSWSQIDVPDTAPVLLFVGRLADQKGIYDFLIHSAHKLLGQLTQHHLVLMGEGEQAPAIRKWCQSSGLAERIHVVGWQPEAIQWMRLAEMLVLPAKYEGMPNVILEAMSVGKPVACFNIDGVEELLGEVPCLPSGNRTASKQIAAALDYDGLEAIILKLAQDKDLRLQCGTANRQRIEQSFQLEQQLAKYEQLYSSMD